MPEPTSANGLLDKIKGKRQQLERYIAGALPRKRRLLNTTILAGSLAAVLTTAPAVGGQPLTAWLTETLALATPSWRILCAVAAICSIMATVSTQLLKSHNIEEYVIRAQACRAKLEVIEVGLLTGQLDLSQATTQYIKCLEDAAFLEGT